MMDIVHKNDRWEPAVGEYKNCIVLYNDHWNDYCYMTRNLLRDVVGRYVGNEPDSLFALEEIQKTAALMRFELERGNVDGFAKLLDYHWELSKKVDAGSSNTLIEQIFSSIEEMIDGRLVCGAGGGGFLQVILKKGITREDVEKRLNEVFMDSLVGVADCKLVW